MVFCFKCGLYYVISIYSDSCNTLDVAACVGAENGWKGGKDYKGLDSIGRNFGFDAFGRYNFGGSEF